MFLGWLKKPCCSRVFKEFRNIRPSGEAPPGKPRENDIVEKKNILKYTRFRVVDIFTLNYVFQLIIKYFSSTKEYRKITISKSNDSNYSSIRVFCFKRIYLEIIDSIIQLAISKRV